MESCKELIQKEEKRYKKLLEYINNIPYIEKVSESLKYLLNLKDNEYKTTIDLENSIFSLASYRISDNLMAYSYEVRFNSQNGLKDYYKAIILSTKEIKLDKSNLAYIDKRFKIDNSNPLFYIGIPLIAKGAVSNFFSDSLWTGCPFIVYGTTNIDLLECLEDGLESSSFVEYHDQLGEIICEMHFGPHEKCSVISKDGFASEDYVTSWVKKNMDSEDDPTKLVEMAGYYNSSNRLACLARTLK